MVQLTAVQTIDKWLGYVSEGEVEALLPEVQLALLDDTKNDLAWKTLLQFLHFYKKQADDKTKLIDSDVLYQVTILCCQSIFSRQFLSVDKIKYLATMYHIIYHFMVKDMIAEMLKLRQFLVLTIDITEESNDELSRHFLSIHKLFSSVGYTMQQKYKNECSSENYLLMLNVMKDSVELLTCPGPKYLNIVFQYVCSIPLLKKGTDNSGKCHAKLLEILLDTLGLPSKYGQSQCTNLDTNAFYCTYVSLVFIMVERCLDLDDFKIARNVIDKIENTCKYLTLLSCVPLVKCLTFLKLVLSGILYPLGSINCDLKNVLDASNDNLKVIAKLHHENKISVKSMSTTYTVAARMMYMICFKWSKSTSSEWNHDMNVDVLTSLHRLVQNIANALQNGPYTACKLADGSDCTSTVKVDMQMSAKLQIMITSNIEQALKNKMEGAQSLLPQAELVQQKCMKNVLDLKASGCPKWENIWCTVANSSYNMGVVCYSNKHWLYSKKFFSELCMVYVVLEDYNGKDTKSNVSLWTCFKCLIKSYEKLYKFEGSLVGMVVALAALPSRREEIFKMWFSTKSQHLGNNSELLASTLWSLYEKKKAKLKVKYPTIHFGKLDMCETLTWELEAFNAYPYSLDASVGEVLMASLKGVLAMSCKTKIHIRGLRTYLESMGRSSDKQGNVEAVKMSEEAVASLRLNPVLENPEHKCTLAEILYFQFVCQNNVSRFKQMSEIANAQRVPTSVSELDEARTDVASGDLVLANISSLNICNETGMMKVLDDSVETCRTIVVGSVLDKTNASRLIVILKKAAQAYAVYGYDTCAMKTWALVYNLARVAEDKITCLLAMSNLMPYIEYDAGSSLMRSADDLAASLADTGDAATRDCLVAYWLSCSLGCLHAGQFAAGKLLLKRATKALSEKGGSEMSVLGARARLVTSQYLYLPPVKDETADLENETAYEAVVDAHKVICAVIKSECNPTNNHEAVKALLSITLWLSDICVRQAWAKKSKKFIKNSFELVQMLSLSTRTAQLLGMLARVDLLCWSLDDCQVKIDQLTNILQIYKSSTAVVPIETIITDDKEKLSLKENCFTLQLQKMRDSHMVNRSPKASPNTLYCPFKLPDFVTHERECLCVYCNNVTIQSLALDMPYFQAQCFYLRLNTKQAFDYFQSAMKLGQRLKEKQVKLFTNLVDDILVNTKFDQSLKCSKALESPLCRSQANGMLWHSDLYACCNKIIESSVLNKDIKMCVRGFAQVKSHLLQEIMEQHFIIELLQYSAIGEILNKTHTIVTVATTVNKTSVLAPSTTKKASHLTTPYMVTNKNIRKSLLKSLNTIAKQEMENAWYDPKSPLKRVHTLKLPVRDEDSPLSDKCTNKTKVCIPNKCPVLKTYSTAHTNMLVFDGNSSNKSDGQHKEHYKKHTLATKPEIRTAKKVTEKKTKPHFKVFEEDSPQKFSNLIENSVKQTCTELNIASGILKTGRRKVKVSLSDSDNSPQESYNAPSQDKCASGKNVAGAPVGGQKIAKHRQFRSKTEDTILRPSEDDREVQKPIQTRTVRNRKIMKSTSDSNSDEVSKQKKLSAISKYTKPKKVDVKVNGFELDYASSVNGLVVRTSLTGQSNVKKELIFSPIECKQSNGDLGISGKSMPDACIDDNVPKTMATGNVRGAVKRTAKTNVKIGDHQQTTDRNKAMLRRRILAPTSPDTSELAVNLITLPKRTQPDRVKTCMVASNNGENQVPNRQSAKLRTVLSCTKLESASSNSDSDEIFKNKKCSTQIKFKKEVKEMHNQDVPAVKTDVTHVPVRSSRRQNTDCKLEENNDILTKGNATTRSTRTGGKKKLPKNPFVF